jgi:hypothetical protein
MSGSFLQRCEARGLMVGQMSPFKRGKANSVVRIPLECVGDSPTETTKPVRAGGGSVWWALGDLAHDAGIPKRGSNPGRVTRSARFQRSPGYEWIGTALATSAFTIEGRCRGLRRAPPYTVLPPQAIPQGGGELLVVRPAIPRGALSQRRGGESPSNK